MSARYGLSSLFSLGHHILRSLTPGFHSTLQDLTLKPHVREFRQKRLQQLRGSVDPFLIHIASDTHIGTDVSLHSTGSDQQII